MRSKILLLLLLLLILRRYARRRAGPSTAICTKETVPYRPDKNLCLPLQSALVESLVLQKRRGLFLACRLSQSSSASSPSSSLLARLYSISRPESISQFRTLFPSRALRSPALRSTACRFRSDRISLLSYVFCFGGFEHHTTRCSTVSHPSPHSHCGVITSGTPRQKRYSRKPISPIRAWASRELWALVSSSCFLRALSVNSRSGGSLSASLIAS